MSQSSKYNKHNSRRLRYATALPEITRNMKRGMRAASVRSDSSRPPRCVAKLNEHLLPVLYITRFPPPSCSLLLHTIPSTHYHPAVNSTIPHSIPNFIHLPPLYPNHTPLPKMHSSILIASFLAIATMAAPTPAAPELKCKTYCCQSLQLPDSSPMTRLLSSLNIPRSDITGLIGIGCTYHIPSSQFIADKSRA